ncbi:putative Uncharacterized ATPase YjoB [Glarea lozoyensis 74030]|uniref:Putative Uncharacterized ATPase YjoB n=1 Tax=Glarea lozoyensis (strain ATCC 74030 / MF5533) TaxID=1104152 RepID=H0EXR5_GLAL7|nr:putative Uncharacterized ATPase YjoB [Glarea lozoyensis 74030]
MSEPQATVHSSRQQKVHSKFREGSPLFTELGLLQLLQETYPDHQVTLVGKDGWDFRGFAAAGVAECQIGKADDFYHAIRSYQKGPGPRLGLGAGKLVDTVKYGRWNYVWQNHEYLIYEIDQAGDVSRRPHSSPLFILNSHVDEKQNNTSDITLIDQLLIAVAEWSCAIHDEIYVYDTGCWRKSSDLWKTVQDSAWEDVILPSDMKASLIEDVTGFFDNKTLYKKLARQWQNYSIEGAHGLAVPSGGAYSFTLLDGLESNDGILMIGSTNHLETLDPAITKRPSRFDRKYHFKLPDEYERCAYIQFWQSKLRETDMVHFPDELCSIVARMSENFSFAYMKELFVMALLSIARGGTGDEDTEKPVMVRRADALAPVESGREEDEDDEEDDEDQIHQKKHVIPDVEVLQSLQNNVLLKVLRAALITLVDEMDSTPERDWPSTKRQTGNFGQA